MSSASTRSKAPSGSPLTGEPEYLLVGILRRPHGLRGELLMEVVTDFPDRLHAGSGVFVGENRRSLGITNMRPHRRGILVKFDGIDTPEVAQALRNQTVLVLAAGRPSLLKGHFYHHQLVGCEVVSETDEVLGTLTEILKTGANDVFVVRKPAGGELLLPAVSSVILQLEPARRLIRVRIPDGLKDG